MLLLLRLLLLFSFRLQNSCVLPFFKIKTMMANKKVFYSCCCCIDKPAYTYVCLFVMFNALFSHTASSRIEWANEEEGEKNTKQQNQLLEIASSGDFAFFPLNDMGARCRCRFVRVSEEKAHTKWINKFSQDHLYYDLHGLFCDMQRKVFQINFHRVTEWSKACGSAVVIFIWFNHIRNETRTAKAGGNSGGGSNLCNLCYKLIVNCQHDMLDIQTDNT